MFDRSSGQYTLLEGIGSFWIYYFKNMPEIAAYDNAVFLRYAAIYQKLIDILMTDSIVECPLYNKDEWVPLKLSGYSISGKIPRYTEDRLVAYDSLYYDRDAGIVTITLPDTTIYKVLDILLLGAISIWDTLELSEEDIYEDGGRKKIDVPHSPMFAILQQPIPGISQAIEAEIHFDLHVDMHYWYPYVLDSDIDNIPLLLNKILFPEVMLEKDVDYEITTEYDPDTNEFLRKVLYFKEDPLNNPYIPVTRVGEEYIIGLWCSRIDYDERYLARMYGNIAGTIKPSSEAYREFLRGIFFMYLNGPVLKALEAGANLILGVPLVKTDGELVSSIEEEGDRLVIYTDKYRYEYKLGSKLQVEIGDTVNAFDTLATAVTVDDFLTKHEWWEDLYMKHRQAPNIEESGGDYYMQRGSLAFQVFDAVLKYSTFYVEADYSSTFLPQNFSEVVKTFEQVKPTFTNYYFVINMMFEDILEFFDLIYFDIDMVLEDSLTQGMVFGPLVEGQAVYETSAYSDEKQYYYGGVWKGLTYSGGARYGENIIGYRYGVPVHDWDELHQYNGAITFNGIYHYGYSDYLSDSIGLTFYGSGATYSSKPDFKHDGEIANNGIYDFELDHLYLYPIEDLISYIQYDGSVLLSYYGVDSVEFGIEIEMTDNLTWDYVKYDGDDGYIFDGTIKYNNHPGFLEQLDIEYEVR